MCMSTRQIAAEAREALARNKETPEQYVFRLVKMGFINMKGEVTTKLGGIVTEGGTADPEPWADKD